LLLALLFVLVQYRNVLFALPDGRGGVITPQAIRHVGSFLAPQHWQFHIEGSWRLSAKATKSSSSIVVLGFAILDGSEALFL
jgi:hypothetical protein